MIAPATLPRPAGPTGSKIQPSGASRTEEAERTSIEDHFNHVQAASSKEWKVADLQMTHKYAEPQDVDVTVKAGGIGGHRFFIISVVRKNKNSQCMLVSDRSGRLVHVTGGLAAMLGSTPHALMANGAARALEALLPQPFALMHRTLAQVLPPPHVTPPPFSCRSGISVLLQGTTPDRLPVHIPVRMAIRKREVNHDQLNVMTLEPVTMPEVGQSVRGGGWLICHVLYCCSQAEFLLCTR